LRGARHCHGDAVHYNRNGGASRISSHGSGLPVPKPDTADTSAKLMLVALGFAWGLTWPAMRISLDEIPPFSMRVVTLGLGAGVLFLVGWWQGRPLAPASFRHVVHLSVAGILNVLSFSLLSVIAMMFAATGRVAVLAYTMPIWAALFAWLFLGERFTRARIIALVLCASGMGVLIWPLVLQKSLIGLLIAISIAVSWAAGTVYVKWARLTGDPVVNAAWQVFVAFIAVTLGLPFVEGTLHLTQAHAPALLALIWSGLVGSGLAYFLWFAIVRRVPAMTASLGVLSAPVIGVVSTAVMLGEIPTVVDVIAYVMIFTASVCVLLPGR
jgi:drug/metabolite transporter (DMT)-like permease